VFGLDNNRLKEKGITLIEALISTVIIGIGFVAVFQMVNYAVQSIDISGERTKTNYLVSMVAEDIISDRKSKKGGTKLYDYLVSSRNTTDYTSWKMGSCSPSGASASGSYDNAQQNKFLKWDNRFSQKRIKCRGTKDIKFLQIYDICKNGCRYTNTRKDFVLVNGTEKLIIGKMEVNLNFGKKKKYLYFQIGTH